MRWWQEQETLPQSAKGGTDAQWEESAPLLPHDTSRGHPRTTDLREVVNGPPEADTYCAAAYLGPPEADWLRWPTGVVGLGHRRSAADGGQAQTVQPPLRGVAQTVGGGVNAGIAEPLPTAEQGL